MIAAGIRRAMVAHARRDAPNECAGFLVGRGAHVIAAVPMQNAAASRTRYRIDDAAHIELRRHLRAFSPPITIVGVYHSHPATAPVPSETDIAEAHYPEWCYVIVGLKGRQASVRAYRIRHGRTRDVTIVPTAGA